MDFNVLPITSDRSTDCGPTCLKMLLNYYGKDAELSDLIRECNVGVSGCTGTDLMRVGKAHGLDMASFKCPATDVYNSDRPAIVWWLYHHFVIYGGIAEDGRVIILNPDRGRYRVSKGVFKSFFSGYCFSNGMPQDLESLPEAQDQ